MHPSPYHVKATRSLSKTVEEQTESGLHVVQNIAPGDQVVLRGIIEEVGGAVGDEYDDLEPGAVLFYLRAIRLGQFDFVLCSWDVIIGWEKP
jgi:hypothetical protein